MFSKGENATVIEGDEEGKAGEEREERREIIGSVVGVS